MREYVNKKTISKDVPDLDSNYSLVTIKKHKWSRYGIIYRILYWLLVILLACLIIAGLHFALKADFGQCSSYDFKCT